MHTYTVCIKIHTLIYINIHMYCIQIHIYKYRQVYLLYTHTLTSIYIFPLHLHTYVHTYIHICMYLYVCVYRWIDNIHTYLCLILYGPRLSPCGISELARTHTVHEDLFVALSELLSGRLCLVWRCCQRNNGGGCLLRFLF